VDRDLDLVAFPRDVRAREEPAGADSLYELCDRGLHVQEAEIVSLLNGIAFFPQQADIALRVGSRLL
jgi:hypothetical protein